MDQTGEQHDTVSMISASFGKLSWVRSDLWVNSDMDRNHANEQRDVAQTQRESGSATLKDAERENPEERNDSVEGRILNAVPSSPRKYLQLLECDFDSNPTELYLALLKKEWSVAISRCECHPDESKTWVSRTEADGTLRWKLLPIHAALIFRAPGNVIQALVKAYPAASQMQDDQGMLPLHLAFTNEALEATVSLLLKTYPGSVDIQDHKGRTALDLLESSSSSCRDFNLRLLSSVSDNDIGAPSTQIDGVDLRADETSFREENIASNFLIDANKEASPEKWEAAEIVVASPKKDLVQAEKQLKLQLEDAKGEIDELKLRIEKESNEKKRAEALFREQIGHLEFENQVLHSALEDAGTHQSSNLEDQSFSANRIKELSLKVMNLEAELRSKTQVENTLKNESSELWEDNDSLRTSLEAAEEENARLRLDIDHLEQVNKEAHTQLDGMEEGLLSELEQMRKEKTRLEGELHQASIKVEESQEQQETIQSNLVQAEQSRKDAEKHMHDVGNALNSELFVVRREAKEFEAKRGQANLTTETLQKRCSSLDSSLTLAKKAQKETEMKLGDAEALLSTRTAALREQNQQLKDQLDEANQRYEEAKQEIESLQEALEITEHDMKEIRGRFNEVEYSLAAEIDSLRGEKRHLESSLRDSESKVEEANRQLDEIEEAARAENASLWEEKNAIQDKLEDTEAAIQKARSEIAENLESSEAKISRLQSQCDDLKAGLQNAQAKIEAITSEKENIRSMLMSQCNGLKAEKETLNANIQKLEKEYSAANAKIEEMVEILEQFECDNEEASTEIKQLTHDLGDLNGLYEGLCEEMEMVKSESQAKQEELESDIAHLGHEAMTLEESLAKAKEETLKLQEEYDLNTNESEKKIEELTRNLEDSYSRYSAACEEFEKMKCDSDMKKEALSTRISQLSEELKNKEDMEAVLNEENGSLLEELTELRSDVKMHEKDLEAAAKTLQSREAEFESAVEVMREENEELQDALQWAENKYQEAFEHIDEVEAALKAENEVLWEENQRLKEAVLESEEKQKEAFDAIEEVEQTLKVENLAIWEEKEILEEKLSEFEAKYEQVLHYFEQAKQDMEAENAELLEQHQKLRGSLEISEAENTSYIQQIEELETRLTGQLESLQMDNQNLQENLTRARAKNAGVSQQILDVQDAMNEAVDRLEGQKTGLSAELEQAEMKVQETLEMMETTEASLKSDITVLQEEKEALEEMLERNESAHKASTDISSQTISDLESKNAELQKQIKFLHASIKETRAELEQIKKQNEMNQDQLQAELMHLQEENDKLEAEAENTKEQHYLILKEREDVQNALISNNAILEDEKETLTEKLDYNTARYDVISAQFEEQKSVYENRFNEINEEVVKHKDEIKKMREVEASLMIENKSLKEEKRSLQVSLELAQVKRKEDGSHIHEFKRICEAGLKEMREKVLRMEEERTHLIAELEAAHESNAHRASGGEQGSTHSGTTIELLQNELRLVRSHYDASRRQLEETKSNHEKLRQWSFMIMKNGKENSSLRADYANALARAALAEAKLKSLLDERDDLSTSMSRARAELLQKKRALEDTIHGLSEGLLGVAKIVDEMVEQQEDIVQEALDHEAEMAKGTEVRTEMMQEAFLQKAIESSAKILNMLQRQGQHFEEHMDAFQSVLTLWSESFEMASFLNIERNQNGIEGTLDADGQAQSDTTKECNDLGEMVEDDVQAGDRLQPGAPPKHPGETVVLAYYHPADTGVEDWEENYSEGRSENEEDDEESERDANGNDRSDEDGEDKQNRVGEGQKNDTLQDNDLDSREEPIDADDEAGSSEPRAGIYQSEEGIEMFNNPYSLGTPRG